MQISAALKQTFQLFVTFAGGGHKNATFNGTCFLVNHMLHKETPPNFPVFVTNRHLVDYLMYDEKRPQMKPVRMETEIS